MLCCSHFRPQIDRVKLRWRQRAMTRMHDNAILAKPNSWRNFSVAKKRVEMLRARGLGGPQEGSGDSNSSTEVYQQTLRHRNLSYIRPAPPSVHYHKRTCSRETPGHPFPSSIPWGIFYKHIYNSSIPFIYKASPTWLVGVMAIGQWSSLAFRASSSP